MRRTETLSRAPDRPHRAAAAEASGRGTASGPAAQRRLAEAVQQAPAMVAQRQQVAVLQAYQWNGEFVGNPAAFHIHAVGGDEHFKYGKDKGTRVNYMFAGKVNQAQLRVAIDMCNGLANSKARKMDETYKADCLDRMRELLEEDTTVPEVETKAEAKAVETTPTDFTGASPYGPVDKSKYVPPSDDDFL